MTVIANWLTFTRLDTGAPYQTSVAGEIIIGGLDRDNDVPAHVHIEIDILSALATAIINATRGPSLTGPIIPLLGEYSMDGGATIDARFVLVSAQRSMDPARPILTIDQSDMSVLYSVTGTDRVTYVGEDANGNTLIRPGDVLNGPAGTIPRPPGHIGTNRTWGTLKGLYQTIPGLDGWAGAGLLQMAPHVDPALANLPLSLDVNSATITASTKAAASRLSGTYLPADTQVPAGARAHIQPHTGDAARSPIGVGKSIAIGHVGTTSRCIFDGDTPGTWDETTTIRFYGAGLALDQMLGDMVPQASFIGGISDHGLADGTGTSGEAATTITDVVVVNTGRSGSAANAWDTNLPIVATSAGVYYHVVGSGFFVPMSPSIKVNAIAADQLHGIIYIATDSGVFSGSMNPPPFPIGGNAQPQTNPFTRVGGITFPVADLWIDSSHNILIRVGGSAKYNGASVDGVYLTPALAGDTSGDSQGYAGWSRVAHSSSILAAGGNVNDIYYVDSNKANTVYHIHPGSTAAPVPRTVATGQSIIGIDTVLTAAFQQVYVRTDAGNAGLYQCQVGTDALLLANNDNKLKSDDGSQVQIRRIRACGITMQGEYINAFACTDAGLYRTNDSAGNNWRAPNAAGGLQDFDISFAAAGTDQMVLGESTSRVFVGGSRNFLVSCDAADTFRDVLADKLDKGPAWYARAIKWGGGWPDNTVTALGNVPGEQVKNGNTGSTGSIINFPSGSLGSGGTILSGPPGDKGQLPDGYIRARRLDEQKQFSFRTVFTLSQAPQGGIQWDELSDLQANANVGVITASEQIDLEEWRFLSAANIPRWQLTLSGSFTQSNAIARDLCPNDMVTFKYNPAGWTSVFAVNLAVYVQRHSILVSGGTARTTTVISNSTETTNLDPTTLAASAQDRLTKKIRWGSA